MHDICAKNLQEASDRNKVGSTTTPLQAANPVVGAVPKAATQARSEQPNRSNFLDRVSGF